MKLVQCDRFKNHYYDGDKFVVCPHCAKLGFGANPERKNETGGKKRFSHNDNATPGTPAHDASQDKTAMLTRALYDDEPSEASVSEQIKNVGVSGDPEDIKTIAMYGFDEEIEPVTGWVVAISGPEKGRSFEVHSGKTTLGRKGPGKDIDISIENDHSVSRGVQAVIIYDPKQRNFLINPTDGASLVYLNESLLMEYSELKAYDKISIGETELLFIPFCSEYFSWESR